MALMFFTDVESEYMNKATTKSSQKNGKNEKLKHLLGSHMSIAGGLELAIERIMELEGTSLQIFTRNQRQWRIPELTPQTITAFRNALLDWGDYPIAVHDSYLVNMASFDRELAGRSIHAFGCELDRVEKLSIPYLVTHPGSAGKETEQSREEAIENYTKNLDNAIASSGTDKVKILLENTSGAGSVLGSAFEELATIIHSSRFPERLGVCFDTCHAFSAGYDLRNAQTYRETFEKFDRALGLDRLCFFHLNDSAHPLGSKKDRHAHIGEGMIGTSAFRFILFDPRFKKIGKIIETPKDKDMVFDRKNLAVLRSLRAPRSTHF